MQILANGLVSGLTLAVLAMGFCLVYLPTRVFAVSLAGLYVTSPYIALQARSWGWGWPTAVVAALVVPVILALVVERFNHRPLMRQGTGDAGHLIASLGLYIVIVQVVALIWGNETRVLRAGIDATWTGVGVTLTRSQLIAGGVSLVVVSGIYAWLRLTSLGLQLRALADNPIQLALFGYNTDALRLLAGALAGALAGLAGLLTAYDLGFDPHGGLHALLLAVVAAIIGGRHSFLAPIIGGVLLGVLRSQVVWHWSARWQEAATFLVLVLVLFLRPQGLLGRKGRLEAEGA
jgi:branched-chain amino acid transport system permease protein